MVDIFQNNLLEAEGSDLSDITESEESLGGKQKEREITNIDSLVEKRPKAADDKTGQASNEDPKCVVLDSIKQDLKADEVGDE